MQFTSKEILVKIILLNLLLVTSTITYADSVKEEKSTLKKAYEDIKDLNENGLYKPHVALMSGVSDPIENGYDAAGLLAVEAGYQVKVPYGVGFEVSAQDFENDDGTDLMRTQFLLKGSYNFSGDTPVIKYSYVGLGLGIVSENSDETASYGAIMPNAGFDIPVSSLSEKLTLGANIRYTATASNEADNYGLNGVVKYWF